MEYRCLIVDDNRQFLETVSTLLERDGMLVVGVASTIADALRKADQLRPDVLLIDIDLGAESGFDLARQLAARPALTASRVLLISSYDEMDFADLITVSPASGFLSKSKLSGKAIREALNGAVAKQPEPPG